MKLAGVIVLYNANEDNVIDNINSYINDIDLLIAVDNTDKIIVQDKLIDFLKHKNILYINNGNNLGIARALNIGTEKAIELGCQWLLTMDQASRATPGMIQIMATVIGKYPNIGIISPVHTGEEITDKLKLQQDFIEVDSVMTSGNLLNLKAYNEVGPFDEKLFIDYVDHEYCLRLNKNNFKVLLATKAKLTHNLGNISVHKIASTTNHNFVRRYYMTRNRLLVQKVYKKDFPYFCKQDNAKMWKELLKICLLEKDKIKKIRAFILGFYHFNINKFGKLN